MDEEWIASTKGIPALFWSSDLSARYARGLISLSDCIQISKIQEITATKQPQLAFKMLNPTEPSPKTLSYVEFYSGVGGWTMALETAIQEVPEYSSFKLERLAALDNSDVCQHVMHHNFGTLGSKRKRPNQAVHIEKITISQVEDWRADIWLMSPPCQPHTRQHDKQSLDLEDKRSQSFLHICELLRKISCPPSAILLENVVGFEQSNSCRTWRQVLRDRNYVVSHWHLTPTQVNLPNDRPRYYCVAILQDCLDSLESTRDLGKLFSLEFDTEKQPVILTELDELGIVSEDRAHSLPQMSDFLDPNPDVKALQVPQKILDSQAAWCFDIVTPLDSRSSCFTHSYGKYIKGSGSVLYTGDAGRIGGLQDPQERQYDSSWSVGLDLDQHLRYFSGMEIVRLFGFTRNFSFPPDCTLKQQWKLMGNSLNVLIAARLCELALRVLRHKTFRQKERINGPISNCS
jgi:tRNA (cytosine38-C5)-methyltransferase